MQTSFTISPMSQTLGLNPGETFTGSISIGNTADSTGDFHYKITIVPYNVSGQDYIVDTSQTLTHSQIAEWITIAEPTGTLAPNETKTIDFTINVPASAPGGGQAAALIVSPDTDSSGTNGVSVDNVFQMASLVYANVAGETTHGGDVLENYIPSFSVSTPVNATALISNTGNVYETATIQLTVINKITGEPILTDSSENGNFYSEIILPETTRYVSRSIENLPAIGMVHVEQSILYNGQTAVTSHDLLIFPVWFMAIVILVIVAIISGIIFGVVHHKRKKNKALV